MGNAYSHGNDLWKAADVRLWSGPRLSTSQAARIKRALFKEAARQLVASSPAAKWRLDAMSRQTKVRVDRAWLRAGVTRVVHDVSHQIHRDVHPNLRPHDPVHASLERHLIRFAIARGYHRLPEPAPRKLKPKPNIVDRRAAQARANLVKAETRLKRAQTLAKKWRTKVAYYNAKRDG